MAKVIDVFFIFCLCFCDNLGPSSDDGHKLSIAGGGKTILSSTAIHHLEKTHDSDFYTAIAYYYFIFTDQEEQTVVNMLRSLIVQLSGRRPDTPRPVQDLRRFRVVNQMPDMESLEKSLTGYHTGLPECLSGFRCNL
ncbi:hypothetical protein BDZ45DRAFT_745919 [Acephala macrosclerotiorum]|nr:hypothetical protein BDZ45DRAFT_745919 [Acephala macrosclerotiorum]